MPSRVTERIEVSDMSASLQPSDDDGEMSKQERLTAYLTQKAEDGEMYFKSKFIADEVGLSPKEIGALMVQIRDSASDIEVEKWSYTSATTWRVEPA
jgi:hypothetical protein